jgi:hypothetical protein
LFVQQRPREWRFVPPLVNGVKLGALDDGRPNELVCERRGGKGAGNEN